MTAPAIVAAERTPYGPRMRVLPPPRHRILVFSDDGKRARPLGPYVEAKFTWSWREVPVGTFVVQGDHPLAERLKQCKRNVVPIRNTYNGRVWTGRVMAVEHSRDEQGVELLTVSCIGDLFWLATILAWVNPLLPPEVQVGLTGKQDVMAGSIDFVLKYYASRNFTRMRKPVYSALPIQYQSSLPTMKGVKDLDTLLDYIDRLTEDLCILSARFTPIDELLETTMSDSERGITLRAYHPELDAGKLPRVFKPSTPSQLESVIGLVGSSTDNFLNFTNAGNPLGLADPSKWNQVTEPCYVLDTRVKRDRRHMQWRTDNGSITSYTRRIEHPTAHSVIVGGKAPEFVNDIVEWGANMAIRFLLNMILPGANLGEILIGDLLDDIFFAYQRFDDYELAIDLGPHGFGEAFGDNTNAWSLDALAVGMATLRERGPKETLKITVQSGGAGGFEFGEDDGTGKRYREGDVMTFWDRGTVIEDYISEVTVEDSRGAYAIESVVVGDEHVIKTPFERVLGKLKTLGSFTRAIANGTN